MMLGATDERQDDPGFLRHSFCLLLDVKMGTVMVLYSITVSLHVILSLMSVVLRRY